MVGLALAFGTLSAITKGNGAGIRDAVGNVSAPWLIVPLGGAFYAARGRALIGAAFGITTTMAAILGFYAANAFVLDLGPHSTFADLGLALSPAVVLAPYGVVTGTIFGAIGAWSAARRPFAAVWIAAGLLSLEPLAWIVLFASRGMRLGDGFAQPTVWAGEAIVGLGLAAYTRWRARRTCGF